MEILSNRHSFRSQSSSRNNKKGLSLTSKSRCSSVQKQSKSVLASQTTLCSRNNVQNQTKSILSANTANQFLKLRMNNSQLTNNYKADLSTIPYQKPKIVFKYANEQNPNFKQNLHALRQNRFGLNHNSNINQMISSNQNIITSSRVQNVIIYQPKIMKQSTIKQKQPVKQFSIIRSIEKLNLSKRKINEISSIQLQSTSKLPQKQENLLQKKPLIDSRKIDRQIISQEIYTLRHQNIIHHHAIYDKSSQIKPNFHQQSSVNQKHTQQHLYNQQKNNYLNYNHGDKHTIRILEQESKSNTKLYEQNNSPYHILISTAKRCQSLQVSPLNKKINEQVVQLPTFSLQRIPQIQEFNTCLNDDQNIQQNDELKIEAKQHKHRQHKTQAKTQKQGLKQKQLNTNTNKSILISVPFQKLSQQSNKRQYQLFSLYAHRNSKTTRKQTKSTKKSTKQNQENILSQLQNQQSLRYRNQTHNKRNNKRVRQIEKRLQQIINICDSNL